MDKFKDRLRITMFPWLAFGHLIPYLELAMGLAHKGHFISLISTPRNIERLPKLPPNLVPLINLVSFQLPRVDELSADAEATMDLPQDKVQYLKVAFDRLERPLTSFLKDETPDWIIYDFAPHWLVPVAAKLGVPCAFFCITNATTLAFAGPPSVMGSSDARTTPEQLTMVPKWFNFPSTVAYRLHEARKLLEGDGVNASGVSDSYRFWSIIQGCHIVCPRSCMEVEQDCLCLLQELYKKPVLPVGLLPRSVYELGDVEDDNIRWLDKEKQGSVIYVAFGSEAKLNNKQVLELAFGLEQSKLPFFWVFLQAATSLPEGFQERNKARGFVCKGRAPQLRILGHPSVGGFLTHSGWGSLVEGLQFGHAFVLLPIALDQGFNARMAEEMKVGVEIPRNDIDGSFTRDSVADSLRLVMVEAKGESIRSKAREMRKIFADRDLHQRYVDVFAEYLKDHKKQIVK